MEINKIKARVDSALAMLEEKDRFLLDHDVSERSITHKLATYLSELFSGYDVDCEYNSNVQSDSGKKYIYLIKEKADKLGLLRDSDGDSEEVLRNVYPDIIVHQRGVNDDNLLIVEVKKTSSQINSEYDHEKLARYTSSDYGNELNYRYGAFIELGVKQKRGVNVVSWFYNGELFV